MSSTNRGNSRDAHISDFYVTPTDSIKIFMEQFLYDYEFYVNERATVLDPCAGGDSKHAMSYPKVLKELGFNTVFTNDIREDSLAQYHEDYLESNFNIEPNIVITNPPFSHAQQIIEKALSDVQSGGFVIMLLRLNFLEGKNRYRDFWSKVGLPYHIYVHPKRLSFTDDGRYDSIAYAHFVWRSGYKCKHANLTLLEDL